MELFRIKRTYYGHSDYLSAWDSSYGTACMGSPAHAMTFVKREDANNAARRANNTCCGINGSMNPDNIQFTVESI